jgi:serine/threonine protein kinase
MGNNVLRASRAISGVRDFNLWLTVTNDINSKQMLRKLRALHHAGFEHGDFKPRNVLVDDNGEVHLIDFGHSKCHRCSRDCEELKWARERFTELTGVNYKSKTKH